MGMFGVTPARSSVCRVLVPLCPPDSVFQRDAGLLCAASCDNPYRAN